MTREKQIVWICAIFFVFCPVAVFAGEVNVPKTGQTTCSDAGGNVIACPGTGQDGDIQAGVAWPEPRFEDNGDGTITDHLTGLIWLKNANCSGGMNWASAVSYCNTLASDSCGLTDGSVAGDWRLPNIVELDSLVNAQEANISSWLNTQGFSNVQSNYYWSSSTYAYDTSYAWYVYMSYGYVYDYNKSETSYVWPVRGGQNGPAKTWRTGQTTSYAAGDDGALQTGATWPTPRFTDNGNGTVSDNLTGLIWLKDSNRFGARTWADALNDCNTLADDGVNLTDGSVAGDWRLPNRKELFSVIDFSRYSPALPQGHPFNSVQSAYDWSSSTFAYDMYIAWVVSMFRGPVGYYDRAFSYPVWPVRGGGPYGGNTPPGNNIVVQPVDSTTGESPVTISFSEVLTGGETTVTTSGTGAQPPSGLMLGTPPTYYIIDTTATFTPPVEVCIDYTGISMVDEENAKLYHHKEGEPWTEITSSIDTENNIICGMVNSFSTFAIFEPDVFLTPKKQIEAILTFFNTGIENKTIKVKVSKLLMDTGDKKRIRKSKENHIELMRELLETAQRLIVGGFDSAACGALDAAYTRIDGQKVLPADWFKGVDAPELADMIKNLMDDLNCQ